MNKQELLKTLEEWKKYRNSQNHELQYYQLAEVINLVEQLDEPQKVKVPAYVAPFIDKLKTTNRRYGVELERAYKSSEDNDLRNWLWFNENVLTVFKALENGYEVEESKWTVNEGDLVIRRGCHEAKVYFVESVDDDGILLVNGIKDEFFTDGPERAADEETLSYFYGNFRLLAKKESLEVEKVEE